MSSLATALQAATEALKPFTVGPDDAQSLTFRDERAVTRALAHHLDTLLNVMRRPTIATDESYGTYVSNPYRRLTRDLGEARRLAYDLRDKPPWTTE
jgi:hypothetical protein